MMDVDYSRVESGGAYTRLASRMAGAPDVRSHIQPLEFNVSRDSHKTLMSVSSYANAVLTWFSQHP
jgi:hypothetical protein